MIVLSARVEAASPERRELVQALLGWAAVARREPGSIHARLSEDLEAPGVYCLSSAWRDSRDLEAHIAGPDFGVLLGALAVLGQRTCLEVTSREKAAEEALSMIRRLRGRAPALDDSSGGSADRCP